MRLPNGCGSIHKLSGKRRRPWRARVTIGWDSNGKQLYFTVGYYKTYKEALAALNEYNNDPEAYKNGLITLKEFFELFNKEKDKKNPKMAKKDRWAFTYCKKIENMKIKEVKLYHLKKVIDNIPDDKWETKRRVKSVLNQLYNFGIPNEICKTNPAKFIELDEYEQSTIHQPFTEEEKQILWDNIDIEYVDMIIVYLYTGFRPSELTDIECDTGVNLEENYLQGGAKTEAGKDRIIPIHPKILPIIQKWYNKANKYLFFNNNGKKFNYGTWEYKFKNIMKKLNMNHIPHDPRHTFASDLDNVGANHVCRQRLLGHASDNITDKVYTHKDINALRKAIELLK